MKLIQFSRIFELNMFFYIWVKCVKKIASVQINIATYMVVIIIGKNEPGAVCTNIPILVLALALGFLS